MITSDIFILQVFIESYYIPDNGDTEIQRHGPCPPKSYKLVGRGKYIDTTVHYSIIKMVIKWRKQYRGNESEAVIGYALGGAAGKTLLRRWHLRRVLKEERRAMVRQEGKAFQVEETAYAKARGRRSREGQVIWFHWSLRCVKIGNQR